MLTVRNFLDALTFSRIAGSDDGSCFGVTDPRELRDYKREEFIKRQPVEPDPAPEGSDVCEE
jgi:hypothetical protein